MLKKLRRRFILVAMLAVALVLVIIMGAINIINYKSVTDDADAILEVLSENGGAFPGMGGPGELPDGQLPQGQQGQGTEDAPGEPPALPEGGQPGGAFPFGRDDRRGIFSEETPFESRFFTVTLDADGTVSSADITSIAAVSEDEAAALATEVLASGRTSGFHANYRYLLTSDDAGSTVIFLDCQRSLANARSFLLISILVSLVGAGAVFFLVILFSRRALRPVAESYEKQKQFITDAGHELKTPLTIIDADISVLEMDLGQNEWLDDVKAQTKRLAGLTNDLVMLSRMEEGDRHLQMIDFPISDVIAEEAQGFHSRAQLENKEFVVDISPSLSYCGDEKSLRQLASILLDNALKYSPSGGRIEVALAQRGKAIEFSVCNTAENIKKEDLPHLFERFYRTDSSRNSQTGGHGIGLSVAKAITEAHKGSIRAESADGKSLKITVEL